MTRIPASIRNNNPGAMYPGPSSKRFGSTTHEVLRSKDGVHKIATFSDPVQGGAAMFDLLDRNYTGMSVEAAITKWCGGYYVSTYTKVLEEKAKVDRRDPLTKALLRDPSKAIPLVRAMAWQEAGRDFPMTDEQWATAHASAFVGDTAPAWTPDNDVPTPKPEMRAAETKKRWTIAATVTSAAAAVPTIDPAAVTTTVGAWKGLGTMLSETGTWVATHGKIGIAAALGLASFGVVRWIASKREGA